MKNNNAKNWKTCRTFKQNGEEIKATNIRQI